MYACVLFSADYGDNAPENPIIKNRKNLHSIRRAAKRNPASFPHVADGPNLLFLRGVIGKDHMFSAVSDRSTDDASWSNVKSLIRKKMKNN